jgi:hypothetical protein
MKQALMSAPGEIVTVMPPLSYVAGIVVTIMPALLLAVGSCHHKVCPICSRYCHIKLVILSAPDVDVTIRAALSSA